MKYRDHRASLAESMATVREFKDRAELVAHLQRADADVEIRPYVYDARTGWDTYIVTVKGVGVVGFCDGPSLINKKV